MKQKPWESKIPKPKKFKDIKKYYLIIDHHEISWKWLTNKQKTFYVLKGCELIETVVDNKADLS